jgi:hypothetical protein
MWLISYSHPGSLWCWRGKGKRECGQKLKATQRTTRHTLLLHVLPKNRHVAGSMDFFLPWFYKCFTCQTWVAPYCKMPQYCVLPGLHFCCGLGHCELSLQMPNARNMWGPPPLISRLPLFFAVCLICCSFSVPLSYMFFVLFFFKSSLFLLLDCSFYWCFTPKSGSQPKKWPK